MSVHVMSHVWRHSPSKSGRLLVLLALADRSDDDGICWPGVNELARKARLSPRQVERALGELERDGEIERPKGRPSKRFPYRIRQNVGPTPMSGGPDTGDGSDPTPMTGPCIEPSDESSVEPPSDPVKEVWETYLEATGKRGTQLNDKRRRVIVNALKVAPGDDEAARLLKCKQAVIGLSLSPHHNGENETGTKYLDIRYALKGIKDESDDERIESMAARAAQRGVIPGGARVDPARAQRRLEEVRANRSSKGGWEPERAARAQAELESWGYRVVLLDEAPFARLESASEGARGANQRKAA